jgi:hypothetical protein
MRLLAILRQVDMVLSIFVFFLVLFNGGNGIPLLANCPDPRITWRPVIGRARDRGAFLTVTILPWLSMAFLGSLIALISGAVRVIVGLLITS